MIGGQPVHHPSDDLAAQLQLAVRQANALRWTLVAAAALLLIAVACAGAVVLIHDEARLQASCQFYRDIATAPLRTTPPAKAPSELGVAIVWHARLAFTGQSCPGSLPPAQRGLEGWVRLYRLPGSS